MRTVKIRLFMAMLLLGACAMVKAQGVMRANADNYFIKPVPQGGSPLSTYLDVLLNDYYADDGTIGDMEVTVVKDPFKGWVQVDAASYRLEYLPMDGSTGMDSLIYQIRSKVTSRTARATVYINLNDKPNVVSDADCFTEPQGINFDISMIAQSDPATNVSSLSSIITGDIDNDGKIEMLVIATPQAAQTTATNLLVYNYDPEETGAYKLKIKYDIPITGWVNQWPNACFSIAKITGGTANLKSTASIFFANPTEQILYRYDLDGGNYTETWRTPLNSNRLYSSVSPIIVDLMANGRQQIVCADRVYDANTGELLVEATDTSGTQLVPASGRSPYSFGCYGHYLTVVNVYESSIIAADIDDDGLPELIAGDHIYKVNIQDFTSNNTTLNTYRLYRKANYQADLVTKWDASHVEVGDGGVAIADIDNDGKLDVIVAGTVGGTGALSNLACVYVYNPRTGKLFHDNIINDIPRVGTNYGPSRPFVGDIDGDGYPEIALTAANTLRAYKMDFNTNTLNEMWRTTTSDGSASTTLSMFDFTQDGTARMIYRDITSLRIIRSTPTGSIDEFTFNTGTFSGTLNECPIVIDVDGDGHAEILATASPTSTWGRDGSLRIYGASGLNKWAPARPVWNQVAYNPVYVNDDLTIPRNPISPATKFVSSEGTVNRPFNNFLQQATSLNREGAMIMEGADLTFSSRAPRRLNWQSNGDLTVTVTVTNQGLVDWTHPISLQMYASHDGTPVTFSKVGAAFEDPNASGLAPRQEKQITFTIPQASLPAEGSYDGWAITVNLNTDPGNDTFIYTYGKECRSGLNNRALGFNVLDGYTIACPGAVNVSVEVNPQGVYDVDWYNLSGTKVASRTDTYNLPLKDNAEVTKLLVQAFRKGTNNLVSNLPDTVYIYRAADSLVWTNTAADRDWNNPQNWRKGSAGTDNYPFANIPMGCTNVTLPAGIAQYPDLKDLTQAGHTDYSQFPVAACANIYFNFGSELERPDLLSYDSARVETRFETHRWYMYSPPLKQSYSGDFYVNSAIPSQDVIKSYTKSWGGTHPFWGGHVESAWTHIYNFPDVLYPAGYGLGVWISDNLDRDNINFSFNFPKADDKYHVYFTGTDIIDTGYPAKSLPRDQAHRFTFDGTGVNGADFALPVEGKKAGSLVFVGNPFMSHLDFDKFYAANSSKIKPEYKVLNRNNNNYLYYRMGQASTLTKDIAPMQGFLVEATVPFSSLTVNGTMTTTSPANTLKSMGRSDSGYPLVIPITVRQEGVSDVAYLAFGQNYAQGYDPQKDVICLFDERGNSGMVRPVSIFSMDMQGVKMNLQGLPYDILSQQTSIPLGIRTPSKAPVTINVGNLSAFSELIQAQMSIYDAMFDKSYSLNNQSMYTFEQVLPDSEYFIKDRFFLNITRSINSIDQNPVQTAIWASAGQGQIKLNSQSYIDRLEVYSLQGKLLYNSTKAGYQCVFDVPHSSLYIIRAVSLNGVQTLKVINK